VRFDLIKNTEINVGISKLKNHVVKEANKTGKAAIPASPKMLTAIDSRMIILPKNNDGVSVTAM
jgi:hypothetical protein